MPIMPIAYILQNLKQFNRAWLLQKSSRPVLRQGGAVNAPTAGAARHVVGRFARWCSGHRDRCRCRNPIWFPLVAALVTEGLS